MLFVGYIIMKPVTHWRHQRISAILLLFLVPWLFFTLICMPNYHFDVLSYFSKPSPATGLMLLVLSGVYHFVLGLTMVVEDYVLHSKMRQIIIQTLNAFGLVAVVFGFVCIVQIIASGGRCS